MTHDPIARLRAQASRGDYASMVRLAVALYAQGLRPPRVLRECFGVEFPLEFFVTARANRTNPGLLAHYTNLPWQLGVPPDQGGPRRSALAMTDGSERRIFARDPDLVPLMLLVGYGSKFDDMMVCYRLSELLAGSATVFGIKKTVDPGDQEARCGESLLAVLRAHHVSYLEHKEWIIQQPSEWGAGAHTRQDVDAAAALVRRVEELQREAGASG
ncbi:MAG: hypothetical protein J2P15_00815 [Micromonosporaceae bacterium]|nr:hypothetical protein [Micromonosporaceae bacterium]